MRAKLFIFFLLMSVHVQAKQEIMNGKKEHWVTVFIHGSYGTPLSLLSFFKVLHDHTLDDSLYVKIQQKIRENPHFYSNRFMSHEQDLISFEKFLTCPALINNDHDAINARLIAAYASIEKLIEKNDSQDHHYYLFGWSGLLSQRKRKEAAIKLYQALINEVKRVHEPATVHVRLIGHSHGGSLALLLAQVHAEQKNRDENFFIDDLILYGTPMQQETESFCFSPFFKKIYNFFSYNDSVQGADFISTKGRLSKQRITLDGKSRENRNIIQINLMVQGQFNKELLSLFSQKCELFKAKIANVLRGGYIKHAYPYDPTHADFWCVEWSKKSCVSPLPLFIFTPLYLQLIDTYIQKNTNEKRDVILTIDQVDTQERRFTLSSEQFLSSSVSQVIASEVIDRIKSDLEKIKPSLSFNHFRELLGLTKRIR